METMLLFRMYREESIHALRLQVSSGHEPTLGTGDCKRFLPWPCALEIKSIGLALEVDWLKDADEAGRGSQLAGRSVHPLGCSRVSVFYLEMMKGDLSTGWVGK